MVTKKKIAEIVSIIWNRIPQGIYTRDQLIWLGVEELMGETVRDSPKRMVYYNKINYELESLERHKKRV